MTSYINKMISLISHISPETAAEFRHLADNPSYDKTYLSEQVSSYWEKDMTEEDRIKATML